MWLAGQGCVQRDALVQRWGARLGWCNRNTAIAQSAMQRPSFTSCRWLASLCPEQTSSSALSIRCSCACSTATASNYIGLHRVACGHLMLVYTAFSRAFLISKLCGHGGSGISLSAISIRDPEKVVPGYRSDRPRSRCGEQAITSLLCLICIDQIQPQRFAHVWAHRVSSHAAWGGSGAWPSG